MRIWRLKDFGTEPSPERIRDFRPLSLAEWGPSSYMPVEELGEPVLKRRHDSKLTHVDESRNS